MSRQRKKTLLTLMEHKLIAPTLVQADEICKLLLYGRVAKSSPIGRAARRTIEALVQLRGNLDGDYHSAITDQEFEELGHIYYGRKRDQ